ncbi:MAG: hypothetical protein ACHQ1F_00925, partial [Spirochaetia bacterium]
FLVCEGMVDSSAAQLVVLCLRSLDDLTDALEVRGIERGSVVAVSGVAAAAGAVKEGVPGLPGVPAFDSLDSAQRRALADLVIKKACPGA